MILKILPDPFGIGKVIKNVRIGKKQKKNILISPVPKIFASIKPTRTDRPSSNISLIPYPLNISLLTLMFFGIRYIYIPPICSSFI